jgi:putative addiction module component (TIGR02574 family)
MIKEELKQKILNLKSCDKIKLVELIMESLDKPDQEIEAKWVKESEKRYDAYKAGKLKSISYQKVMDKLKK